MAVHIPFAEDRWTPPNNVVPGNEDSPNPVTFILVPAEGPDLVRLKSVIYATLGLVQTSDWTGDVQQQIKWV